MHEMATTDDSSLMLISGTLQGTSELQQSEDRLQMLKEAIDSLPIGTGITISDVQGKIIYVNAVEAEMHGYLPDELIGKDASILAPRSHGKPFPPLNLAKIGYWRRECLNVRKNGTEFPVQLSSIAVRNAAEGRCIGVVTACEDITSRKDSEKKIEHLAYYDTVTGLPNRVLLMDRLHQALALAHREGREVALLSLDLDNFKDVNDTQGHDIGDKFLREVAKRLTSCLRESNTLARVGGDEFVMVLNLVRDEDGAAATAQQILSLFLAPFLIDGQQFYSSASIGIALYPDDGVDAESLLQCADAAMYHAKDEGKSNYQFFSSDINNRMLRRVSLVNSMRRGISRGEFALHYQPKWDVKSGALTGVEALLRWNGSDLGCVTPHEFIPIAEKSGLIFELGEMVLRTACQKAREWACAGHGDLRVAVNISGRQFRQPDFLETVARIICETRVAPGSLELEFTESVIMEKADKNIDALRALKKMGVRLSIDDFGTGYSSLNYLKHFPIDAIKIDRSFIADVDCNSDDAAITEAIISMAHSLKLRVIAEGVENGEQLQFLRERNCDEVQGYYLALPMSESELISFLESRRKKAV
jgi:diguanylate cyclase (GGDEF)-like protein/PAS domain S-box-containing protein